MADFFESYIHAGETVINNLLISHYQQVGMTNQEFLMFIQVKSYMDRGHDFPDINQIAKNMGESEQSIYQLLHELIAKKLLEINSVKGEDSLTHDVYDFSLLYKKLAVAVKQAEEVTVKQTKDSSRKQLFTQIETEFGRTLSPIELETIGKWLDEDHYQPDLISLALKEAVLNQVYNFKYIDRILINWEKNHIQTPAEAQRYRTSHTVASNPKEKKSINQPKIPIFNITDQDKND